MSKRAVILLSGGLDSTTVLAYAKNKGYECYAISFDYSQRHNSELNQAKSIANKYEVLEHKIVNLDFLAEIKGSALTDRNIDVPDYKGDGKVPVTYVPARNTIFITIALAWAEVIDAEVIMTGASAVDYSGYCDCRPEYYEAFQNLVNFATDKTASGGKILLETPLINLSKQDTIKLGHSLGVDYHDTISCYQADENGLACGRCDSCHLRKKGFADAGIADETNYK